MEKVPLIPLETNTLLDSGPRIPSECEAELVWSEGEVGVPKLCGMKISSAQEHMDQGDVRLVTRQ